MKKLLLLVVSSFFVQGYAQTPASKKFALPSGITAADYMAGKIIIKLKEEHKNAIGRNGSISDTKLAAALQPLAASAERKFPAAKAPAANQMRMGKKFVDLTRIYELSYSTPAKIEAVINSLLATGMLEYAEPHYLPKLSYAPNDPYSTTSYQWHLNKIKAYQGWDISKGDTTIVIGITDSGNEINHPDLKNNVKYNYADPINGSDDDSDGYVDNYRGWDLGDNDNNPQYGTDPHGVHVAGLAAASTDNATGVAGVGFKCKFLPVKVADASGALSKAYEGITYAADHGCKIINCSWGSAGGGQFGQDVIDYATINMDALVIAACGNDGQQLDFFPASYNYVISVASTNQADFKSSFSNYGYNVDVCAPGSSDYSTWTGTTYTSQSGTSMASPVAAGAAALIRSMYPSYNALQAGQKLKITCDNIYTLSANAGYVGKLGKGRINLQNALSATTSPSLELIARTSTDNNDNAFVVNDTLRLRCDFTNYLSPTTNLVVNLSSTSPNVTILDGSTTVGVLGTMGTANNNTDPYTVKINPGTPQNTVIVFKLTFSDGTYTEDRYFSETVNVDYINIDINDVATSITSKGKIGYNQDGQVQGLGFKYLGGATQLYEAGLMIGNSSSAVSDVVRSSGATGDTDFQSTQVVSRIPSVQSDFDVTGKFGDAPSSTPINVEVMHNAFAWTSAGDRKYVIVEYKIRNSGTSTLSTLHAGIFADWDLLDYAKNKAAYDAMNRLGYVYSTDSSLYMGIRLLSQTAGAFHYALDNVTGGGGGLDISGGYSTSQKFTTLSTNRAAAGGAGTGNDVCHVVSSGPFSVAAGDTVTVAFALLAGDNLADLQASSQAAQIKYDNMGPTAIKAESNLTGISLYPNPVNDGNSSLRISLDKAAVISVELLDMTGRLVYFSGKKQVSAGSTEMMLPVAGMASGIYLTKVNIDGVVSTHRLSVGK